MLIVNLTTALAWSSYFSALARIEPSIVNTLHNGMAPLTAVTLAAFVSRLAEGRGLGWAEYLANAAIAATMLALAWVVMSGASGGAPASDAERLIGLGLLLVSGSSITVSLLYCKRLHDCGVAPDVVTAIRYGILIVIAGAVLLHRGDFGGIEHAGEATTLAFVATVLIVLPLYAFQVGIAHTAPITGQVMRALAPVFVFALQPLDGRLSASAATLIGILAYSAAAAAANLAHALRNRRRARPEDRPSRLSRTRLLGLR